MPLSYLYQDFGSPGPTEEPEDTTDEEAREELRLKGFEAGYQAGWEDAVKAQEGTQARLSADVAQNLQDMSFTYHEVYAKLAAAMRPLMTQMVTCLLPEVSGPALAMQIRAQIDALISTQADNAIEIATAPESLPALRVLLEREDCQTPFSFVAEEALSAGQAYLRVNAAEREIDLDAVRASIAEAVEAFFQQLEQEHDR
jgi:flagellar biosynthesis/type III secretory pathway protein FliH